MAAQFATFGEVDDKWELVVGPTPDYEEANKALLELVADGHETYKRAHLVVLKNGIKKRRPVKAKSAPAAKKVVTKKAAAKKSAG